MQAKQAVVRFRVIDGTWETCSTDRARGIWVENLILDWDTWGSKTATFDLRRDPRVTWPDLRAYTDVEIDVSGTQIWKGRIQGTPSRAGSDPAISVQCEGMQSHLDDDVLTPAYVHTDLSAWKDARSYLGTSLLTWQASGTVEAGNGKIVLAWPNNQIIGANCFTGAILDLGPDVSRSLESASIDVQLINAANMGGNGYLFIRAMDALQPTTTFDIYGSSLNTLGTTAQTLSADFTAGTVWRYLAIFLFNAGGATTMTGDASLQVTGARIFTDTTYRSGAASILTASTVVNDALSRGTSLLSPDMSGIGTTSFAIPTLHTLEQKTPREVISAVNAYHNYVTEVDERGRFVFGPKPSAPLIEVGEHTALEAEDASSNSGEDIYNRVLVVGTTSAGDPQINERLSSQLPGQSPVTSLATFPNPGFEGGLGTSGWSVIGAGSATLSTTTTAGEVDSGVFGGKLAVSTNPVQLKTTATGPFYKGRLYQATFRARSTVGTAGPSASFGVYPTDYAFASFNSATFVTVTLTWIPKQTVTTADLIVYGLVAVNSPHFIDSLNIYEFKPTLVDKRGFNRTKVLSMSSPLDVAGLIGTQLGDTYLASHKTAQFKGSATVTGPTAREILTSKPVQPEQLGLAVNGLLRFNDRVDPDTGAMGRDGRIAAVNYNFAEDKARVTIDNTSQNFEALLARLAVISGNG
jgi:hypothetical protein